MVEPIAGSFAFGFATFVLAGLVKGVIGLGLPTVAMGLLAVVMAPAQAAAPAGRAVARHQPLAAGDRPEISCRCCGGCGRCCSASAPAPRLGAGFLVGEGGQGWRPWRSAIALMRLRRSSGCARVSARRCRCAAKSWLSLAVGVATGRDHGGDRRVRHSGGAVSAGAGPRQGRPRAGARRVVHGVDRRAGRAADAMPASLQVASAGVSALAIVPALARHGARAVAAGRRRVPKSFRMCFFVGAADAGRAPDVARRGCERRRRVNATQLHAGNPASVTCG